MKPTPEQKEFLRAHSITRCPPSPAVGLGSSRLCRSGESEADLIRELSSVCTRLTFIEKFAIDKMKRARKPQRH